MPRDQSLERERERDRDSDRRRDDRSRTERRDGSRERSSRHRRDDNGREEGPSRGRSRSRSPVTRDSRAKGKDVESSRDGSVGGKDRESRRHSRSRSRSPSSKSRRRRRHSSTASSSDSSSSSSDSDSDDERRSRKKKQSSRRRSRSRSASRDRDRDRDAKRDKEKEKERKRRKEEKRERRKRKEKKVRSTVDCPISARPGPALLAIDSLILRHTSGKTESEARSQEERWCCRVRQVWYHRRVRVSCDLRSATRSKWRGLRADLPVSSLSMGAKSTEFAAWLVEERKISESGIGSRHAARTYRQGIASGSDRSHRIPRTRQTPRPCSRRRSRSCSGPS